MSKRRPTTNGPARSEPSERTTSVAWLLALVPLVAVCGAFVAYWGASSDLTGPAKDTGSATPNDELIQKSSPSKSTNLKDPFTKKRPAGAVPVLEPTILQSFPHDDQAFTQGLVIHQGQMYEGTGLHRRSSLRQVDLETGRVLKWFNVSDQHFGEGITVLNDKIYQLTWRTRTGFVYDMEFNLLQQFSIPFEGWGLTNNGSSLIASDGSPSLYFINPDTLQVDRTLQVRTWSVPADPAVFPGLSPIQQLNELEFINGYIYANIWYQDLIAVISPKTGIIQQWLDLSRVYPRDAHSWRSASEAVLNGIAFDSQSNRLFVTGKLWPVLVELDTASAVPAWGRAAREGAKDAPIEAVPGEK